MLIGLIFAYVYHNRIFNAIDKAISYGQPIGETSNSDVFKQNSLARAITSISGPNDVITGTQVAYLAPASDVEWSIEGDVDGEIATSTDALVVTFRKAGPATIIATKDGDSMFPFYLPISVRDSAPNDSGIRLPFVMQNWGRFVLVSFGVGLLGAMIVWDSITAEAGIGMIGTLLGVGAASASTGKSDESNTDSRPKS